MIKKILNFIKSQLNAIFTGMHFRPEDVRKSKSPVFCWHFSSWKHDMIKEWKPDNDYFFLPLHLKCFFFDIFWKKAVLANSKSEFFVWGIEMPEYLSKFIQQNGINITYVEDGFIRSAGLGADKTLPMSLVFDSRSLYFDASKESDLENILNTYDFKNDAALMDRAVHLKKNLLEKSISKYNHAAKTDIDKIYGEKVKKRILVIGQVEDDASIKYGCNKPCLNNDLVRLAAQENPEAEIIYKLHPDIINNKRKILSSPYEVSNIAKIIDIDIPITQAFETIDHVYTITSLAGFEALLRGIRVTAAGSPFYAHWGVTTDLQTNRRRSRKLSVDEILAGAYLLYCSYYDYDKKSLVSAEDIIEKLACGKQ